MILIPAIDIKGGRCVRLLQGDLNAETVYSDDPLEMAQRWEAEGAERLHLVDLDGAVVGKAIHFTLIERIVKCVKIPVQIGGGIRTIDQIDRYLSIGLSGVILGTIALKDPLLLREACLSFRNKIIVGIDSRKGKVAIRGWVEESKEDVISLSKKMADVGVASLILTDIEKDGMLEGPHFGLYESVAKSVDIPIIASGGVTTLEQIKRLSRTQGVSGAIIGKTLYEGRLSLPEALAASKEEG
ncbi:MAG: 1-(5-phosphoribosyl)-5-[(5-phosphoribosylamino)methylideneamino]imidazole-4-carboxamide isomerase [Nitrospiria bacterium]